MANLASPPLPSSLRSKSSLRPPSVHKYDGIRLVLWYWDSSKEGYRWLFPCCTIPGPNYLAYLPYLVAFPASEAK
jgi:hypothetical protein